MVESGQTPYLELFVEEPSMRIALLNLLPKVFIDKEISWDIREFRGKMDLLKKLPARLKGRGRSMRSYHKIVVIVDEDRQDRHVLKERLEAIAAEQGLLTKTAATGGNYQVLNRIVVEELEAWFFGDPSAVTAAFPKVRPMALTKAAYRVPDDIRGGTWERLEKILQGYGYYSTGMVKTEVAGKVSAYMDIDRNTSESFKTFVRGLRDAARTSGPDPCRPSRSPSRGRCPSRCCEQGYKRV